MVNNNILIQYITEFYGVMKENEIMKTTRKWTEVEQIYRVK